MKQVTAMPEKIWNRAFVSVFVANVAIFLSEQMIQALIAPYAEHLGATDVVMGVVASAFAITALLLKVVSAPAIDAFNKKYILFFSMLVLGVSSLGFGLSSTVTGVFVFRLLQGAAKAFTATCCLAMATDALPMNKLGQGIAMFSMGQAISQAVGPTIGKFVQGAMGYNFTFFLAAGIMVIGSLSALAIQLPPSPKHPFQLSFSSMFAKEALLPSFVLMFLACSFSLISSFLYAYAEERLVPNEYTYIGIYFTIYALVLLVSRPLVGRLMDKLPFAVVTVPAMGCFALSFVMLYFANSLWAFYAAAFVSAFGYGACQPAFNALCMKLVPADRRGAGSCTNYIGVDFGYLIGPTLGGAVASTLGRQAMWLVMTLPILLGAVFTVALLREKKLSVGKG